MTYDLMIIASVSTVEGGASITHSIQQFESKYQADLVASQIKKQNDTFSRHALIAVKLYAE